MSLLLTLKLEEYRNRDDDESSLPFDSSVCIETKDNILTVNPPDTGIIVGNGRLKPNTRERFTNRSCRPAL